MTNTERSRILKSGNDFPDGVVEVIDVVEDGRQTKIEVPLKVRTPEEPNVILTKQQPLPVKGLRNGRG